MSPNNKHKNLRAIAAKIIHQVVQGHSLSDILNAILPTISDVRDQALVQAICYGVCRWYYKLRSILNLLLEKKLKEKDADIYCLLLVGLCQLIDMRIPPHAAVAETVAAVKDFKKLWAKSLVNAILRSYQRQFEKLNESIKQNSEAFYSHPSWMIEKINKAWPGDWRTILLANNQHPPFAVRVNQKHITREEYLKKLENAIAIHETKHGIVLENAVDVNALNGFAEGDVSVQDGAAQLAADLLLLAPKQNILDACAAPGGKTAHILELQSDISLTALDKSQARLNSVKENLERLKLSAQCICADAGDSKTWWNGKRYDRILLDAPCSASGVIRRHPDIKLLRRESDLIALAKEQARILNELWPLLTPNGLLVYATCSIFSEENSDILQSFLAQHADAKEEKIESNWGKNCVIGKQILPGMHNMDGFYYARLRKI